MNNKMIKVLILLIDLCFILILSGCRGKKAEEKVVMLSQSELYEQLQNNMAQVQNSVSNVNIDANIDITGLDSDFKMNIKGNFERKKEITENKLSFYSLEGILDTEYNKDNLSTGKFIVANYLLPNPQNIYHYYSYSNIFSRWDDVTEDKIDTEALAEANYTEDEINKALEQANSKNNAYDTLMTNLASINLYNEYLDKFTLEDGLQKLTEDGPKYYKINGTFDTKYILSILDEIYSDGCGINNNSYLALKELITKYSNGLLYDITIYIDNQLITPVLTRIEILPNGATVELEEEKKDYFLENSAFDSAITLKTHMLSFFDIKFNKCILEITYNGFNSEIDKSLPNMAKPFTSTNKQ